MQVLNGDHAEFEMQHADTPQKERPDWPLPSFDARDWAEAFMKHNPRAIVGDVTEEIMVGWFANALMRGYDQNRPKLNVDAAYEVICKRLAPIASKEKVRAVVIEALRASQIEQ